MEKVTGCITISFDVTCPHCDANIYDQYEREWWRSTMGDSFPSDGVDGDFEATCPKCEKEFIIEGFIH